ncbi:UNVERIFIED_CONTAM: hypothetical protein PYX00_004758 [Menopon gallinae]|uniref:Uncharacterized protein n=1 Tax=Menopon gallinae TaxID=328185 RepID=A0AAW2I6L1_9NEOP
MVLRILICVLPLTAARSPSDDLEFPALGDYLSRTESSDLSEFINSHYIRIKLPTEAADSTDSSPVEKGRGNGLNKLLLLALLALKIKFALAWTVLVAVAVKSFLAGLLLAKNVAVVVHRPAPYRFEDAWTDMRNERI